MRKLLSSCIVLLTLLLISTKTILAKPIINEIFPVGSDDWVEIYNPDSETFDLSRYVLRDSSKTNKVTLSGSLPAGGFSVFAFGNKLNNGGDTVKLVQLSDNAVVDELSYGKGTSCAPAEGQSVGRSFIYSQPTKGQKNNDGVACVAKEKEPTIEKTPSPSPQIVEVSNPTEKPVLSAQTIDTPEPTIATTEDPKPTGTVSPEAAQIVQSHSLGNAIIIVGILCIVIAILGFLNILWKRYNKQHA